MLGFLLEDWSTGPQTLTLLTCNKRKAYQNKWVRKLVPKIEDQSWNLGKYAKGQPKFNLFCGEMALTRN
jgi:hypothetical protein